MTSDTRGQSLTLNPLNASPESDASPRSSEDADQETHHASMPSQEPAETQLSGEDPTSDSEFWLHMTATLDACFDSFKAFGNDNDFDSSEDLLTDAPRIMQSFLSHGDACTKIEAEALELVANGSDSHDEDQPLRVYNEMLKDLERLQKRADSLELSISKLAGVVVIDSDTLDSDVDKLARSKLAARLELRRVFAACLPLLRARKANLTVAQDLIDGAQESLSISLKMEHLGID